IPRSRRSLLQRAGAKGPRAHTAAEERMTPTPVMPMRQDEPAPVPLTPAPVPARRGRGGAPPPETSWGELPPPEGAEPWAAAEEALVRPAPSGRAIAGVLLILVGLATLLGGLLGLWGGGTVEGPELTP